MEKEYVPVDGDGWHKDYFYSFSWKDGEEDLARLEMRAVFGRDCGERDWIRTGLEFRPERSPFIRQRLAVWQEADTLEELIGLVEGLDTGGATFKVRYVKTNDRADYGEQRRLEGLVGAVIDGPVDVRQPQVQYGLVQAEGRWLFGLSEESEAVWLRHQNKPQGYSNALNTRVARAMANMALPHPDRTGRRLVDPCCGIGTVLVEALSMGLEASGSDVNPLAVKGARINLTHYGFPDVVKVRDIGDVTGRFDAAVVDLPYNLCSVSPPEEQLRILRKARELAARVVIALTEETEELVGESGLRILDRCIFAKGKLRRQIMICE